MDNTTMAAVVTEEQGNTYRVYNHARRHGRLGGRAEQPWHHHHPERRVYNRA